MAKQPEQILEEQLVAQLQRLCYGLAQFHYHKSLTINSFNNLILKMFTKFKKDITFIPTVPLLLPVRTAQGSFFLIGFVTKLIHLFCLSLMHTEGVFSFNNILQNG
jgi:hypothetical protein